MAEQERDFKGVWIPKSVWTDKRLNALDKMILAEIDSLDNGETGCYASNKYIAEFCQCGETKVSTSITNLIKCGYVDLVSFDGRTRILKSRLSKSERQTFKIREADFQDLKHINIDDNPKKINIEDINYIVEYLNSKADLKYRPNTSSTVRHIKARLNEGFSVEDFRTVIDKKVVEWKGTDMEKYLRPETLFGSKFESYLNDKTKTKKAERSFETDDFFQAALKKTYEE